MREELHPLGLEVVTVALDTAGLERAAKFIDDAHATHPSLVDQAHVLDEAFGIVNVPSGIWIDEDQMIVRPPEPAFPGKSMFAELVKDAEGEEGSENYAMHSLAVSKKIRRPDPKLYLDALRDWASNGASSRYALSPDEVIARSHPRSLDDARAAAHFELGQHLHRSGHGDDALAHFKEAHRLAPRNWTYKRQAWSMVDKLQGPSEVYEGDWANDVLALGPDTYYEQSGPAFE